MMPDGKITTAAAEAQRESHATKEGDELGASIAVKVGLGVAALSWWMLLMTAAFFHTWFEKFTGLVVALSTLYATYFLPRAIPALRVVLGMPGV